MKRIFISILILISTVIVIQAEKIFSWQYKNSRGQIVIIEKYKNEPDGQYKLILIKENDMVIERTHFYKGNKQYKEKQIDKLKDELPATVYIFYEKNNPDYKISAIAVYYDEGAIMTTEHRENPHNYKQVKEYIDINSKKYKQEVLFYREEGWIKEDVYYEDGKVKRIDNFYKNHKDYIIKGVIYFKSYIDDNNNVKEKEEQYYENHPVHLIKINIIYNDKNNYEEYYFYENNEEKLDKIVKFYKDKILTKQEQYYNENPEKLHKLDIFYSNGKITKLIAYDKDGNILPDD